MRSLVNAPAVAAPFGLAPLGAAPEGAPSGELPEESRYILKDAFDPGEMETREPAAPYAKGAAATMEKNETPQSATVPVFITSQSLITFPVASSVVMFIWKILGRIFPGWASSESLLLIIALLISILIYYMSEKQEMSNKQKVIAFIIALINGFFLAGSALGIISGYHAIDN